jgi:2-methylcitrate dehydratase PrpD
MDAPVIRATNSLTERLAVFSASFSLEQAPANVLSNAKIAILDCLGVSVLAATQEIGTALRDFAHEHASSGPCTIWGTDITTEARDAALINGTLAHGLDFDDRNHSSTYSLAASVSVAEARDLPGKNVIEGFIVGREIRNSLDGMFAHRGSGIGPGAKGWHSNGILGPIASACAAAKTLGLDAAVTRVAVGLATASSGALTRDGGTMAKPFRTGHAASTGVTCVLLAKSGLSSDLTAIEGRYGLLEALGPLPPEIVESLAVDLGKSFNLEAPVRIKQFASCSASHGGVEAMLRLRAQNPFTADEVESIHCDLKPYPLVREWPARGVEGRFSMRFCLAMALTYGGIGPEDFTDENVNDPRIQRLMQRTYHDASRSLVVRLRNGHELEQPIGRPTNLANAKAIEKKFHDCVAGSLSTEQASAVAKFVNELETLTSIRALTRNLLHARH